ncbi:AlpA family phage regulatory protein [Lichenihabitans sp. Uapishka_5]|uniref:helix-turn-helix transcriptional regulator n=1 Tax=Lichenihabitans sp. Uapishka_5 TaxID=3037302 RepID=UPI0029E7E784|nr:AlpA family phage regulatory protein [Lichenihabitans sp. Uapishka_5]MDX7952199.1 AlpA family phage regulatory protein [Lichenihabitans sp. Uapishka_5]
MSTTAKALATTAHQLLNVTDVRQRIKVSVSTLYRWMDAGTFPKPLKLGDACVRWREEDLVAWIASKT